MLLAESTQRTVPISESGFHQRADRHIIAQVALAMNQLGQEFIGYVTKATKHPDKEILVRWPGSPNIQILY